MNTNTGPRGGRGQGLEGRTVRRGPAGAPEIHECRGPGGGAQPVCGEPQGPRGVRISQLQSEVGLDGLVANVTAPVGTTCRSYRVESFSAKTGRARSRQEADR